MTKSYDIDHELYTAVRQAMDALMNVPIVGQVYDNQHAYTQLVAYLRLKDALDKTDVFY